MQDFIRLLRRDWPQETSSGHSLATALEDQTPSIETSKPEDKKPDEKRRSQSPSPRRIRCSRVIIPRGGSRRRQRTRRLVPYRP